MESVEANYGDSVAIVKNLNEIITIEESQSTQDFFNHIINIKEELKNQTSPGHFTSPKRLKNSVIIQNSNLICADCEEVDCFTH